MVCKSPPHGIDGRYCCVGRTRDYLNPAGNTITIGANGVTLTGLSNKQNDTISALEEDIVGQSSKIDVISGQVDRINESKMYRTEIITEGVSIFREKSQRSTVRCKVYSWDNQIRTSRTKSAQLASEDSSDEAVPQTKRPHDTKGYTRTRRGKVEHVRGYSTGKNRDNPDNN